MTPDATPAATPRFCSDCGTALNQGARFCHNCGVALHGRAGAVTTAAPQPAAGGAPKALVWGVPTLAVIALIVITAMQSGTSTDPNSAGANTPLDGGAMRAPDISSMSPEERADRLFNRIMLLSSDGKRDSVEWFAPMARGALEALAPLDLHRRYDLGLIELVSGNVTAASAQADTILAQRPTHLLGLILAARAADTRSAKSGSTFWRRLVAAESSERARGLPEYADHDREIVDAVAQARQR
jgi:hypothetical protein